MRLQRLGIGGTEGLRRADVDMELVKKSALRLGRLAPLLPLPPHPQGHARPQRRLRLLSVVVLVTDRISRSGRQPRRVHRGAVNARYFPAQRRECRRVQFHQVTVHVLRTAALLRYRPHPAVWACHQHGLIGHEAQRV